MTYPYASSLIMRLDGAAQVDCGTGLSNLFAGDTSYAVEAWVKLTSLEGTQMIVSDFDAAGDTGLMALALRNGRFAGIRRSWVTANTHEPAVGRWYHVALTYSATADVVNLYIDGFLVASRVETAENEGTSNNLWIGGSDGSQNRLQGSVRSVAVWSESRAQIQVRRDMTSTPPAGTAGLAAWIRFDQNPIADVSGNNVPTEVQGTLSGSVETTSLILDTLAYGDTVSAESFDFSATAPFTVETMVRLRLSPSESVAYGIFGKAYSSGPPWSQYALYAQDGRFQFDRGGNSVQSPAFEVNQWYAVAATYDGSELKLYVDGSLVDSAADAESLAVSPVSALVGAKRVQGGTGIDDYLPGEMAYVRVWERCLDADEIAAGVDQNPLSGTGLSANYDFSSMTELDESRYTTAPRKDLTQQNEISLSESAEITHLVQPVDVTGAVPPPQNVQQFISYEQPSVADFQALADLPAELLAALPKQGFARSGADLLTEDYLQTLLGEYVEALPKTQDADRTADLRSGFEKHLRELFDTARADPEALRGGRYVKTVREDGKLILRYFSPEETGDVLEAEFSDQAVLLIIEFVLILVLGLLNVLGIAVGVTGVRRLGLWLAEERQRTLITKVLTGLITAVTAINSGGALTASILWGVVTTFYAEKWWSKILLIAADLGFWVLASITANLATTILFPAGKLAQILASLAVLAIHLSFTFVELIVVLEQEEDGDG